MSHVRRFFRLLRDRGPIQALKISLVYLLDVTRTHHIVAAIDEFGWRHGLPYAVATLLLKVLPDDESGENVFNRQWDVLVVVDTCRPEWVASVAKEYDILGDVETVRSVGARTSEWVSRTFTESKIGDSQVTYIYGSKYGDMMDEIPTVRTGRVESDEFPYPPAHLLTEKALAERQRDGESKLIVHYPQPHLPLYETNGSRKEVKIREGSTEGVLRAYSKGAQELESLHIENLRYVLDEIEILVNSMDDCDIVLTADHGQMLGERFIVGHPHGLRHDAARNVPWVELEDRNVPS